MHKDALSAAIPTDWDVTQLGEVLAERLKNGQSSPATGDGDGVRTLTLSAVTQWNFSESFTKFTSANPDRVRDLWLRQGDILIERANTRELVGTAALYDGPPDWAIYPDLITRVRIDPERVLPEFAAEFLASKFARNYFRRHASGSAGNTPKVSHRIIERLPVPVPPIAEQGGVAKRIQQVRRKAQVETARSEALRDLLDAAIVDAMPRGPQLMHGTFTEHATVQGPILKYADQIGWSFVTQEDAVALRGGEGGVFFYEVLRDQLLELNPGVVTTENVDEVTQRLENVRPSIEGNEETILWLRGRRSVYVDARQA